MNRFKLFAENFLVYGLGGVISKIIPFLLIPLVTRLMPSSYYYGLNDIYTIVVSFGTHIAILGMYDAMFRLFFDFQDINYKKDICSTVLAFVCLISSLIFLCLFINRDFFSRIFWNNTQMKGLLFLSAFTIFLSSVSSVVLAPTRMNNQKKIFLVANLILPVISYSGGIFLLMKGYYILALPLANMIANLTLVLVFSILNRKWFSLKHINLHYIKPLLKIALPLFPNFIIYWIFNSSDRLMIAQMLGVNFTGIYAVGAKFGQISQLIYSAFVGGWQYFAFSTMHDNDQVELTSKVFEYLGAITYIATILCMMFIKPMLEVLLTEEYFNGIVLVPYLFLSPLLLMLYQIASNQFLIIKKTWPNIIILSIGATSNIIINFILIKIIGLEGAAIGTLAGYCVSVILCTLVLLKKGLLVIEKKFVTISAVLLMHFIVWRITYQSYFEIGLISGMVAITFIGKKYLSEVKIIISLIRQKK